MRAGEHPLIKCGGAPEEFNIQGLEPLCTVQGGQRGSAIIQVEHAQNLEIGQHVVLRQLEDAEGSLALDLVQQQVNPQVIISARADHWLLNWLALKPSMTRR